MGLGWGLGLGRQAGLPCLGGRCLLSCCPDMQGEGEMPRDPGAAAGLLPGCILA